MTDITYKLPQWSQNVSRLKLCIENRWGMLTFSRWRLTTSSVGSVFAPPSSFFFGHFVRTSWWHLLWTTHVQTAKIWGKKQMSVSHRVKRVTNSTSNRNEKNSLRNLEEKLNNIITKKERTVFEKYKRDDSACKKIREEWKPLEMHNLMN